MFAVTSICTTWSDGEGTASLLSYKCMEQPECGLKSLRRKLQEIRKPQVTSLWDKKHHEKLLIPQWSSSGLANGTLQSSHTMQGRHSRSSPVWQSSGYTCSLGVHTCQVDSVRAWKHHEVKTADIYGLCKHRILLFSVFVWLSNL